MTNSRIAERFRAIRRTKLYDLLAATPLIAWYAYCATHMLPSVVEQVALVKLFIQTDPSVLPPDLLLRTLANVSALLFFAVLIVMFALRHVPQRTGVGFFPRIVAVVGAFLGVGIVLLPQ